MTQWHARALILRAILTFHLIDAALRARTFEVVLDFLRKRCESSARTARQLSPAEQEWLVEILRMAVRQIRRFDVRARRDCLPRALTVYYLLARRGVPLTFSMGVRKHPFGAHAWVEHEGKVISDHRDESSGYVPIMRIASHGGAGSWR